MMTNRVAAKIAVGYLFVIQPDVVIVGWGRNTEQAIANGLKLAARHALN